MTLPSPKLWPSPTTFPNPFLPPIEGYGDPADFPVIITDEFVSPTGRWYRYDAVPEIQRRALHNQRHVDIRSFVNENRSSEVTMLFMDRLTINDLDGKTLSDFTSDAVPAARLIVEGGERWTNGTVKPQSDRNNWNGISVTCDTSISNLTTTQSVIAI